MSTVPGAKPITKSAGVTPTEQSLARLCEGTFLKLWSYPNPYRKPTKELCDLIAVFDDHVFLFFDRHVNALANNTDNLQLGWDRWKREAITKQIRTAQKARTHILANPSEVYLDARCSERFPIRIAARDLRVHMIIVAHGAAEACRDAFPKSSSGSLPVAYSDSPKFSSLPPFFVQLGRANPVHLFDSETVDIILGQLDTFSDFRDYIVEKEAAIARFDNLVCSGEENLLAHYYGNYDVKRQRHVIGPKAGKYDGLMIPDGEWQSFIASGPYQRKVEADRVSYLWDDLLQRTSQHALDGTLIGDGGVYESQSAIFEMAREPRVSRRALAEGMRNAFTNFPDSARDGITRQMTFMPSIYPETGYVVLQLWHPNITDYEGAYRTKRRALLEIACGVARNKFPKLSKVVGIAIDAPKYAETNSEDFLLLKCAEWSDEQRDAFTSANRPWRFFETGEMTERMVKLSNFPRPPKPEVRAKLGRNDLCFCGSGVKFKKCHGK